MTAPVSRGAKVIHARLEYEDIANIYPTDVAIVAGMKETVSALNDAVKSMATGSRLRKISGERLEAARADTAKREATRDAAAQGTVGRQPDVLGTNLRGTGKFPGR